MRRSLSFLSAVLLFTFLLPYTVYSEGIQGTGDVSPATPSYDHPLALGNRNYVVTVGLVSCIRYPIGISIT